MWKIHKLAKLPKSRKNEDVCHEAVTLVSQTDRGIRLENLHVSITILIFGTSRIWCIARGSNTIYSCTDLCTTLFFFFRKNCQMVKKTPKVSQRFSVSQERTKHWRKVWKINLICAAELIVVLFSAPIIISRPFVGSRPPGWEPLLHFAVQSSAKLNRTRKVMCGGKFPSCPEDKWIWCGLVARILEFSAVENITNHFVISRPVLPVKY